MDDTGGVHTSYNEREEPCYQYRSSAGWVEESIPGSNADNDLARSSIQVGIDGVVRVAYWSFATYDVLWERLSGVWAPDVTGAEWGRSPSLVLDGANAAHILCEHLGRIAYVTNESGGWTQELLNDGGGPGDIVLTEDETPIVAYPVEHFVLISETQAVYDMNLFVSTQLGGQWQAQSLLKYQVSFGENFEMNVKPRLGLDELGVLHLVYRDARTGDILYGRGQVPTGAHQQPAVVSGAARLRVAPNPFNPATVIHYVVPYAGRVHIDVYNARSRQVRCLLDDVRGTGEHSVAWDGRADGGRPASGGVYFVHLLTPGGQTTRRAALLK